MLYRVCLDLRTAYCKERPVPVRNQPSAWVPTTVSEDSVLCSPAVALCTLWCTVQRSIDGWLASSRLTLGVYTPFTGRTSKGSCCACLLAGMSMVTRTTTQQCIHLRTLRTLTLVWLEWHALVRRTAVCLLTVSGAITERLC